LPRRLRSIMARSFLSGVNRRTVLRAWATSFEYPEIASQRLGTVLSVFKLP
jgi:hypothetical protein